MNHDKNIAMAELNRIAQYQTEVRRYEKEKNRNWYWVIIGAAIVYLASYLSLMVFFAMETTK